MSISNITQVHFNGQKMAETSPLFQYDYGQKLKIAYSELPNTYEVHFSTESTRGNTVTVMGDSSGVTIPDSLLQTGKTIYAFLFLHDSSNDGRTMLVVKIPVIPRAQPSDTLPTQVEQSALTTAIAALQGAAEAMQINQERVEAEVREIVDAFFASEDIGAQIGALSIADGTLTRAKVDSSFEATLVKADNSWQKSTSTTSTPTAGSWESIYDPVGYGQRTVPIDPYSFAQGREEDAIKRLRGIANVGDVQEGSQRFTITDSEEIPHYYTGIDSALTGVYELSNIHASSTARAVLAAGLAQYIPFDIQIVTSEQLASLMTGAGAERTFYLVSKDSGYEKYWYVKDQNGQYHWDNFGSSSTVVAASLESIASPEADIDYIVGSGSDYQYYKYIDNTWCLIAGSNAQIINVPSTITPYVVGKGVPTSSGAFVINNVSITNYINYAAMKAYSYNSTTNQWVEGTSLITTPSETKDYYIKDENNVYRHFRYISGSFVEIGSDAYSRSETDTLLNDLSDDLSDDISEVASDLSTLQTSFNNLTKMVKDIAVNEDDSTKLIVEYSDGGAPTELQLPTGTTITGTLYNVEGDSTLHFYGENGVELEDLAVEIQGGGGGGAASTGNVYIGYITGSNVQTVYGNQCVLEYSVLATDAQGVGVGNGTGTLYINNIAVKSGFTVATSTTGASNTIDVSEFLAVGINTVKIGVVVDCGDEAPINKAKTWTVNAINMYFTWNYNDSQINTSGFTDYCTLYGALSKTIYSFIDIEPIGFNPKIVIELPDTTANDFDADDVKGINYFVYNSQNNSYTHYVWSTASSAFVSGVGTLFNAYTTARSGIQQSFSIPMQTHGSHTIARFMIATVNGVEIQTDVQVHDMAFVVAGTSTPVISVSFNTSTMTQYNTVQIPIVVYDPSNTTTTVQLYEDNTLVSTWTGVDRTVHYWNYSPTTYGVKELKIKCGATTKTLNIQVTELDISEAEVTGYDFRFKASEMATNAAVQAWTCNYTPVGRNTQQTVDMTFSSNFDWVNGGLHTETDENGRLRQYLAVRAGTYIDINYPLFGNAYDPKQYGKNFKFIFKAVNCRTYDANVLTCMDSSNGNNGVGVVLTANEGTLTTLNETVKTYYCKDSYIEFEANIYPNTEYPYLQIWMDGCPDSTKLYSADDSMQQVTPANIRIGSANCDVYVYMIKAYPVYMSNDNAISNFIMDAPNAYDMVSRYERNDVLNASGEVDYQKLSVANPDLHVLLLDLNRMSTGKKDNVVASTCRHIYNAGGSSQSFTVNNVAVTIQGTSSVGYLESAGNMDLNFKYNSVFTADNESYTTGQITFDDGTTSITGFSMNENSIPVDYLNVKVNVASSENANNACIADWYNTFQPWKSPARRKNSKARDTIEFVPGAVFIRDRSGNLFNDTTGYHLYGICDIGNSKKNTKVFHDTKNPIACCVEVANNTSLPCLMSSKTYTWNAKNKATVMEMVDGELKEQTVYEFRYLDETMATEAKNAWDRFVAFLHDYNPNLATNDALSQSVTFGTYTFKGSGTYNTSSYESDSYKTVFLYGYGAPATYGYAATNYVTDTSENATCYYYINYSNNKIYSSNGTTWTEGATLTWTADNTNVLAGTPIKTYAGTYTHDTFNYRMAYLLAHCEEYMIMDPVIYHFIFIESYLMTDNVAKNTFWSSDDLVHWEPSKNYDND